MMFFKNTLDESKAEGSINDSGKFHIWFAVIYVMIFSMVMLGGITRLTGSGLSMVDWNPIMGALPPLSEQRWIELFNMYKTSPEYMLKNFDMDLAGFKSIFWLEYLHRLLGRLIGVVMLVPFFQLIKNKDLRIKYGRDMVLLFSLGLLQGIIGWYMVKSGLVKDPNVSQYRLALHLSMALLLMYICLRNFIKPDRMSVSNASVKLSLQKHLLFAIKFIIMTIFFGAFVAGLKAGLIYNTFPLMDGDIFPAAAALNLSPIWLNFFENHAMVQFIHRLFATISLTYCLFIYFKFYKEKSFSDDFREKFSLLPITVLVQYGLGVITLLSAVLTGFAWIHQMVAFILFSVLVMLRRKISDLKSSHKSING